MAVKLVDIPPLGTVRLYKRRGARSIRLSISAAGDIKVTLPYWAPYNAGTQFAKAQAGWIQNQLASVANSGLSNRQPIGKAHTLYLVADAAAQQIRTLTSDSIIRVRYPSNVQPDNPNVQRAAERACIAALRDEAEAQLPGRLRELAAQHGFSFHSVVVKQLTGRWGSCDSHTNIVLNLYLMQLPWKLIDYVLLHELTHTVVLRHGPDFWAAMARVLPDVRVCRQAIKQHRPVAGFVLGGQSR